MKKMFLTAIFTATVGLLSAYTQVDEDDPVKTDEERLTQDKIMDDPMQSDSAMMKDGEIIEDRLRVDTIGMEMDTINNDTELSSDRTRHTPKRESDE